MGYWRLQLTVKILAFLRLTANIFPLRLTKMLIINLNLKKKNKFISIV